jgi:hypothetical protein
VKLAATLGDTRWLGAENRTGCPSVLIGMVGAVAAYMACDIETASGAWRLKSRSGGRLSKRACRLFFRGYRACPNGAHAWHRLRYCTVQKSSEGWNCARPRFWSFAVVVEFVPTMTALSRLRRDGEKSLITHLFKCESRSNAPQEFDSGRNGVAGAQSDSSKRSVPCRIAFDYYNCERDIIY